MNYVESKDMERDLIVEAELFTETMRIKLSNFCARHCKEKNLCNVCTLHAMQYHLAFFNKVFGYANDGFQQEDDAFRLEQFIGNAKRVEGGP